MNGLDTTSAALKPQRPQSAVLFNKLDNELTSTKTENAVTVNEAGNIQKEQLVADYLKPTPSAGTMTAPKIAEPTAQSTTLEGKQQLPLELMKIKASQEAAPALLQEKLLNLAQDLVADPTPQKESVLKGTFELVLLAGANSVPSQSDVLTATSEAETELVRELLTNLDKAEEKPFNEEYKDIRKDFDKTYEDIRKHLKELIDDFKLNPDKESASALASALICLLVEVQALKQKTQAKLAGLLTEISYECAKNQAEATRNQGDAAMWGGISSAVVSVGIAVGAYATQQRGAVKRDEAFEKRAHYEDLVEGKFQNTDTQKLAEYKTVAGPQKRADIERVYNEKIEALDREIAALDPDRQSQIKEKAKTSQLEAQDRLRQEYKQKISENPEEAVPLGEELNKKLGSEERKYLAKMLRMLRGDTDSFVGVPTQDLKDNLKSTLQSRRETPRVKQARQQKYEDKVREREGLFAKKTKELNDVAASEVDHYRENLKKDIHELEQLAAKWDQRGGAFNSSFQVAQVAQASSRTIEQAEMAKSIMDSAESSIYKEMASLAMQTYSAGDSYMTNLVNNMLDAILRSPIETNKAIAAAIAA